MGWTRLHFPSHSQKITAAIKNTVDFGWIHSSGCSLHHQEIVDVIARSVLEYLFLGGASEETGHDGSKQAEGYKGEDDNSVAHVSRL